MSKKEVTNIMGNPTNRSFVGNEEIWIIQDGYRSTKIIFVNDRVYALSSYRSTTTHPPTVSVSNNSTATSLPATSPNNTLDFVPGQLSDAGFIHTMKSTPFDQEKFKLLQRECSKFYFTCQQTSSILKTFPFSDERFRALQLLAPRIYDLKDYQLIMACFSRLDEEKVEKILFGESSGNGNLWTSDFKPGTLSRADFIAKLKRTPFEDDQFKLLTRECTKGYFTCQEVSSILKLFPFSDEKTKALRILAPRITDLKNYKVILSCFSRLDEDKIMSILFN